MWAVYQLTFQYLISGGRGEDGLPGDTLPGNGGDGGKYVMLQEQLSTPPFFLCYSGGDGGNGGDGGDGGNGGSYVRFIELHLNIYKRQ